MMLPIVPNVTTLAFEALIQLCVPLRHSRVTEVVAADAGFVKAPWQRV